MASKSTNAHTLLLGIVAVAALVCFAFIYVRASAGSREHFVADDGAAGHGTGTTESDEYQAKLHVMKVFDLALSRKPTPEEIKKYSAIGNEQDILLAVLADHTSANSKAVATAGVIVGPAAHVNKEKGTDKDSSSTKAVTAEAKGIDGAKAQSQSQSHSKEGFDEGKDAAPEQPPALPQQICMRRDVLERAVQDLGDQLDKLRALVQSS